MLLSAGSFSTTSSPTPTASNHKENARVQCTHTCPTPLHDHIVLQQNLFDVVALVGLMMCKCSGVRICRWVKLTSELFPECLNCLLVKFTACGVAGVPALKPAVFVCSVLAEGCCFSGPADHVCNAACQWSCKTAVTATLFQRVRT